jgi:NAD(P)H-hydrate epimerase
MENAGRGCAELLMSLGVAGPVVICCGKGNNGGDGFVMARHLDRCDVDVRVILTVDPKELVGDAAVHFRCLERCGVSVLPLAALDRELSSAEWIVDALFGFGLNGPVRSPFDMMIEKINASSAKVFAVDIPSGLDCDTGEVLGTSIKAHHTATMLALKVGFPSATAQRHVGIAHVIDIGMSPALLM